MLTLWNPHRELFRWTRDVDNFCGWNEARSGKSVTFAPDVDVEEKDEAFLLTADLPGVREGEIKIEVHEGTLTLSGSREEEREEKGEGRYLRERRHGSFERQFRLGRNVDSSKIEAGFENGVLQVVLPKKEELKPRQIPVSVK